MLTVPALRMRLSTIARKCPRREKTKDKRQEKEQTTRASIMNLALYCIWNGLSVDKHANEIGQGFKAKQRQEEVSTSPLLQDDDAYTSRTSHAGTVDNVLYVRKRMGIPTYHRPCSGKKLLIRSSR